MENQPNAIPSQLTEKASKGRFLKSENSLQNHSNEGKGKEKKKATEEIRKGGEEKRAMVALLVFIMSYFGYSFWPKNLLDGKGPFDDNVFKAPARYIQLNICYYIGAKNVRGKIQRVLLTN